MFCPLCGYNNMEGEDLCNHCGSDLMDQDIPLPHDEISTLVLGGRVSQIATGSQRMSIDHVRYLPVAENDRAVGIAQLTVARRSERGTMIRHALAFVLGFSLLFVILGASVGVVGFAVRDNILWVARVAGAGLVLMGVHLTGLISVPLLSRTTQWNVTGNRVGGSASLRRSFFVGSAFSIGWTPCVGPILAGILTLAATSGSVAQATLLLAVYSAGMAIPFLLAAAAFSQVTAGLRRIGPATPMLEVLAGVLLVFMGMLIVLDSTKVLNNYFTFLPSAVDNVSATGGSVTGIAGLAIAFFGGLVSILSPCMLPMVPVYLGHLAGVAGVPATSDGEASYPVIERA